MCLSAVEEASFNENTDSVTSLQRSPRKNYNCTRKGANNKTMFANMSPNGWGWGVGQPPLKIVRYTDSVTSTQPF